MKKTLKTAKDSTNARVYYLFKVHSELRVFVVLGLSLGNDFSFWTSISSCFRKYKKV